MKMRCFHGLPPGSRVCALVLLWGYLWCFISSAEATTELELEQLRSMLMKEAGAGENSVALEASIGNVLRDVEMLDALQNDLRQDIDNYVSLVKHGDRLVLKIRDEDDRDYNLDVPARILSLPDEQRRTLVKEIVVRGTSVKAGGMTFQELPEWATKFLDEHTPPSPSLSSSVADSLPALSSSVADSLLGDDGLSDESSKKPDHQLDMHQMSGRLSRNFMSEEVDENMTFDSNDLLFFEFEAQQRATLIQVFKALVGNSGFKNRLKTRGSWLDPNVHYCKWEGITCARNDKWVQDQGRNQKSNGNRKAKKDDTDPNLMVENASPQPNEVPDNAVTRIELGTSHNYQWGTSSYELTGTIPTTLHNLEYLITFSVSGNELHGTIPGDSIAKLSHLQRLDLADNFLTGSIPNEALYSGHNERNRFPRLLEVSLADNALTGSIPIPINKWSQPSEMYYLDLSHNCLTGTISHNMLQTLTSLEFLFLSENLLTGSLPEDPMSWYGLNKLRIFDAASNRITKGDLTLFEDSLPSLYDLNLAGNDISGPFPDSLLQLTKLQALLLSDNRLTGTLPDASNAIEDRNLFAELGVLMLGKNEFAGTVPISLLESLQSSLRILDLSYNSLSGTMPTQVGLLTTLHTIDVMGNQIRGTIPNEMMKMNPNLRLNFTDNLITGTIPSMFCGYGASSMSMLYREFGCDAVLCRPGTFNIHGHATLHSACRECPAPEGSEDDPEYSVLLGRTSCPTAEYIHGDVDGDGQLSPREVLRMIYIDTLGRFWGPSFQTWADMSVNECKLTGITCVNGQVARIDLTSADMCSNGERRRGPRQYCKGIPAEIGNLSNLEVLQLSKRSFLRGTIPTEIGKLTLMRLLDVSACALMSGTIPSEIANLTNLKRLILSHSRFSGTIPTEIYSLSNLEKFHVTNNKLKGTLPTEIGRLKSLKEFMISRNNFSGTFPTQMGRMAKLENLEAYLNSFTGKLPAELALPTIKRIDAFGNQLNGTIPIALGRVKALQILHLKDNRLTGTIPSEFGELPYLSWFDVSQNFLLGTIPSSFGTSQSLEDFRIDDNYIYGKIPSGLCKNHNLNGGAVKAFQCQGIACHQGWYAVGGHATVEKPCQKCPEGTTNIYLGSSSCKEMDEKEIFSIFFEVMQGSQWPKEMQRNWGNRKVSLCEWNGFVCDENGEVMSLSFPKTNFDGLS